MKIIFCFFDWLFFIKLNQWGEYLFTLFGSHFNIVVFFIIVQLILIIIFKLFIRSNKKTIIFVLISTSLYFLLIFFPFQLGYNTNKLIKGGYDIVTKLYEYKNENNHFPYDLDELISKYIKSSEFDSLNNNFKYKILNEELFVLEIHTWYLYTEFYRYIPYEKKFIKTDD